MKKVANAELDARRIKSLVGKSGDLTLMDGSFKKGLEVVAIKTKAILLTVKDKTGSEYPIDLDTIKEFTEYGTKWMGKQAISQETEISTEEA